MKIYTGRKKIITTKTPDDMLVLENVISVVNSSAYEFGINSRESHELLEYRNGHQKILSKEKSIRPEINNKVVMNHAQMITREIVGYFLGTPIQYIQNNPSKQEQIDFLNKIVSFEDKSSVDRDIADIQSVCGTAYRVIYRDGKLSDEIPFENRALTPVTTYVVYTADVGEYPVCAVHYTPSKLDINNFPIQYLCEIYTEYGRYRFETDSYSLTISSENLVDFFEYNVGEIPIIEYPNNPQRVGDWELMIDLMDTINSLDSGRLDDIDQVVQSLLVLINGEIDETTYRQMRESGLVSIKNAGTGSGDTRFDIIKNTLDQSGMNIFSQELEDLLYCLVGIPSRNNRSGGGGDTGQAVELRDGWANLEIVARNKELTFKKSEKKSLKVMLNILKNDLGFDLSLMDIDIKFSRNKNSNLLVKVQGYSELLKTRTLHPADCLTIVDLVSDVNEYIARGELFWEGLFAQKNVENKTSNPQTDNTPKENV